MTRLVEILTAFPTVVFTSLLAFCLAWWLVSLVISGIDGDFDADGGDADGDIAGVGEAVEHFLMVGTIPLSLACTIVTFGGWVLCITAQLALDALDPSGALRVVVGLVVLAGAVFAGGGLLRLVARPARRIFVAELAPARIASMGATCRVRTPTEPGRVGDAEVLTGPTRGSLVRVRSHEGAFVRGDIALIIDFDEPSSIFTVTPFDGVFDHPVAGTRS